MPKFNGAFIIKPTFLILLSFSVQPWKASAVLCILIRTAIMSPQMSRKPSDDYFQGMKQNTAQNP